MRWLFSRLFDVRLPTWADTIRTRLAEQLPETWFDQNDCVCQKCGRTYQCEVDLWLDTKQCFPCYVMDESF